VFGSVLAVTIAPGGDQTAGRHAHAGKDRHRRSDPAAVADRHGLRARLPGSADRSL
jgi:hypothetical protein